MTKYFIILLVFLAFTNSYADVEALPDNSRVERDTSDVGIEENLGGYVDLDVMITTDDGQTQRLGDIIDKPTVLSLVYYRCPGICNGLLNGIVDVVERVDMEPGEDFQILSLSFDHTEGTDLALGKKNTYISQFERKIDREDWIFATADSITLASITDSVGFNYQYQEWQTGSRDFLHAGALIFIGEDGMITRYLNGTEYLPFNLKMAVVETKNGTPQPTINTVLDLCFKYDPEGRTYVFDLLPVIGTVMLLTLGVFITYLVVSSKKDRKNKEGREA